MPVAIPRTVEDGPLDLSEIFSLEIKRRISAIRNLPGFSDYRHQSNDFPWMATRLRVRCVEKTPSACVTWSVGVCHPKAFAD